MCLSEKQVTKKELFELFKYTESYYEYIVNYLKIIFCFLRYLDIYIYYFE